MRGRRILWTATAATLLLAVAFALSALAGATPMRAGGAPSPPGAAQHQPGKSAGNPLCDRVDRFALEKQLNFNAARILKTCGRGPSQGSATSSFARQGAASPDYG